MSIGTIIVLGISAALGIVSLVLSAKAQDAASNLPSADRQTLGDMQITEQREGIVVPIVYGHATVTGSLIWWEAEKMNTGSNAMYYRYKCWQTICMGDIDTTYDYRYLTAVIGGVLWGSFKKTYINMSIMSDEKNADVNYKELKQTFKVNFTTAWINDFLNSSTQLPACEVINGTDTLDPKTFNSFNTYPYATRLKGVTSILLGFYIEKITGHHITSPAALEPGVTQIPTFKFTVRRTTLNKYDIDPGVIYPTRGSNPAAVYYDLLTNEQYGGDVDPSEIDDISFQDASTYFFSKDMTLNFAITQVTTLKEIILKLQEWTDSYLVKDTNNKYAIKILKETDTPVTMIDIDDKQIEFTLRRKSWDDTYNCFTANYKPLQWKETVFFDMQPVSIVVKKIEDVETITLKNEANIQLTGSERLKTVDLTCFSNREVASQRLTQIMKKESYPYANAILITNMEYYYLRVGDVVTIDSDSLNVSAPFRVININYQKIDENKLTFELLQMRELLTDVHYSNCSLPRGTDTRAQEPLFLENVTFPAFSSTSNKLSRDFIDDSKSVVHWGTGQLRSGRLEYGIDYTVVNHNKIKLDDVIYEDEIGFNGNGLLNIDVFEDIISES